MKHNATPSATIPTLDALMKAVTLVHAKGAPQQFSLVASPLKANQLVVISDSSGTPEPLASIEGELPTGFTIEAYASRGGDLLVLHTPNNLAYFLFPGAIVQHPCFKLSVSGETLLSAQQLACPAVVPTKKQTITKQAMILGAGLGSRIQPLTETYVGFAKPALPFVGESSVIGQLVEHLANQGIERLFVNTFFERNSVVNALETACKAAGSIEFFEIKEDRPTGTAGGVLHILNHLQAFSAFNVDEPLLVLQGDAVTNADHAAMLAFHQQSGAAVTIGAQKVSDEDVSKFGIIATTADAALTNLSGSITRFLEKPSLQEAGSYRLASTGFYAISPSLYPRLQAWYAEKLAKEQLAATAQGLPMPADCKEFDFAVDVFGSCLAEQQPLQAFQIEQFWCDIGNPAQYLQTLQLAYEGVLGFVLPQPLNQWYWPEGVVFWPKTAEANQANGFTALRGGVVVCQKVAS
jgi:NDP-sugar pyrophosphorylase family protein